MRPGMPTASLAPKAAICVVAASAPCLRINGCARSGARPRLDIPRLEKSSGNLRDSRPSDLLAVGLAVDETAVQDADQTVGQSAQSLMVGLAACAQDVVSTPGAVGASERGECPLVAGVGEPAVACHPGENDLASAGSLSDGRGARIALASLRMQKSGSVITELGHSPGAEDNTESRQTEVDLGVRVLLKTRGQLLLEGCDLLVELFDDCHGGGDTMAIGFNEKRGRLQLGQSQLGLDLSGLCLQISLPAPMAESRDDFCLGEGASTDRGRGLLQDGNRVGRVQVVERAQGSGVKLTQRVAKLVDLALSSPDQTLMSSGKDLDRLGEVGISGQRPISVTVGADEVRQDPSIAGVGLRTRGRMAVSIAARGQRINGIDLVAGGHQRADEQASVDFDANDHPRRIFSVLGDEGMQLANSIKPFWNSSLCEHLPLFVDHANVVVGFGPVDSYKDHRHLLGRTHGYRAEGEQRRANRAVLKAQHPTGRPSLLTCRRGHCLGVELRRSASVSAHPPKARMNRTILAALRLLAAPDSARFDPNGPIYGPNSARLAQNERLAQGS